MAFMRVRSARKGDPKHEFYVSTEQVEAEPQTYEVLDGEPVDVPGEVVYVVPEKAATKPRPKAAARRRTNPSSAAAGGSKSGGEVKEKADD
jgi:hypothetical protein